MSRNGLKSRQRFGDLPRQHNRAGDKPQEENQPQRENVAN
jgi:hypothetical protein